MRFFILTFGPDFNILNAINICFIQLYLSIRNKINQFIDKIEKICVSCFVTKTQRLSQLASQFTQNAEENGFKIETTSKIFFISHFLYSKSMPFSLFVKFDGLLSNRFSKFYIVSY